MAVTPHGCFNGWLMWRVAVIITDGRCDGRHLERIAAITDGGYSGWLLQWVAVTTGGC